MYTPRGASIDREWTTAIAAIAVLMLALPTAAAHVGDDRVWHAYEVGPTTTPVVGVYSQNGDPAQATDDGTINVGGAFVCNWDAPKQDALDHNCADVTGDGEVDRIVEQHNRLKVISLDDVWGPGVRNDVCVDGNNDSICIQEPEKEPQNRTDANMVLCNQPSGVLDYRAQRIRAENSDFEIGDAFVFLAGPGNQGVIDETTPDPFRCPTLPAPTGATTGGVLGPQGFGNNGISFEFQGDV